MNFERPKIKTGPRPEQQLEVSGANHICYIMDSIKKKLETNKDFTALEDNFEEVKSAEKFIEQNLPELTKEEKFCRYGFYSPAHMIFIATKLLEKLILKKNTKDLPKALTTVDQIMRLFGRPMYKKEITTIDIRSRLRYQDLELPNIIEIPASWKQTPKGKEFPKKIDEFINRRKQDKPITQRDLDLLKSMMRSIIHSYEGVSFEKQRLERAPFARELILINLEWLRLEAEKYKGQMFPVTETNLFAIQLVRGLYYYNEKAEINRRLSPADIFEFVTLPRIVRQPGKLMP
ncbi:hypothetical protein J7K44_01045 [bacterium]|nr:hypothetical protein [bacterium]